MQRTAGSHSRRGVFSRVLTPAGWASILVYASLLVFGLLEQFGRVTSDTRTAIITAPVDALRSTLHLWNPMVSLGELQNQAYGYLWPMGPFFALGHLADVPPWVTERLWTTLLLVVGCEGGRLLARALGLATWPAWFAGMAYGLNARVIGQVAVRSAEVLPGVVLPWVVLPIVLALTGRLTVRRAAVLSVAAYSFTGAVNGTATIAPLPLVVVLLVWGVRSGRAPRTLLWWWGGLFVVANAWWATALLKLSAYSPPFFDFVEDAKVTTVTTGFLPSLRAMENWVGYLTIGDTPGWPAGYALTYQPALVVATTALATIGLVGLVRWGSPYRQPMLVSAVIGLVLLTIAHTGPVQSPLAPALQDLLDGAFALLRNVAKVDPVFRLPVSIGVGVAVAQWVEERSEVPQPQRRWRRAGWVRPVGVGVVGLLLLGVAQPALAMNLRTPGWDRVPDYWQRAADFLAEQPGNNRAWVVPGAGFGVQTWGWTMDEPMSMVATTPWTTRSQVPLTPPETIRALSRLEDLLDTGTGSPYLGDMLARLGIGYVVVRHDLDPSLSESVASPLVSIAVARSAGVTRVADYGSATEGVQVEVLKVTSGLAPDVGTRPARDAVTLAAGPEDVLDAVGLGVIAPWQPALVHGDDGWAEKARVAGDSYRLRERNFGRVHDSQGPVLARDERRQGDRRVPNYPGSPGAEPVYARYFGIKSVNASSTQASVVVLGAVRPETAPFSAVDGDPASAWETSIFHRPDHEWLQVDLDRPRTLHEVTVTQPGQDPGLQQVLRWRLEAGNRKVEAETDPFTGRATFDLGGVDATTVRVTAVTVAHPEEQLPIGVSELDLGDPQPGEPGGISRTLVVPERRLADDVTYLFSARPETRACVPTLLGPDCRLERLRTSDESAGIDRTVWVPAEGDWRLRGRVTARSGPAASSLLDPLSGQKVQATSTYAGDPQVSVRFAYDGATTTSWMADPRDDAPTLTITFDRTRTLDRILVAAPSAPAVAPTTVVLKARDGRARVVRLGGFGNFDPVRTDQVTLTFRNPTRAGVPIGLSELELQRANITRAFDGATRTGALCGFGPPIEVEGRTYQTRVLGVMGDVAAAGQLALIPCQGPIHLTPGEHRVRVRSTNQFLPVALRLAPAQAPPQRNPSRADQRTLYEATGGRTDSRDEQVFVLGRGPAALLTTTRNANPGWRATLAGHELKAQRVDGWAQGWRVPAGEGGRLVIDFAPQRGYLVGLLVGLVGLALVLAWACLILVRLWRERRRRLPGSAQDGTPHHRGVRSPQPWRRFLRGELWLVVAWSLGGLPGVAGLLVAWTAQRLGRSVAPVAVLLIAAAAVVGVVSGWEAVELNSEAANALAGVGVVALLVSAWPSPFSAGRRS